MPPRKNVVEENVGAFGLSGLHGNVLSTKLSGIYIL